MQNCEACGSLNATHASACAECGHPLGPAGATRAVSPTNDWSAFWDASFQSMSNDYYVLTKAGLSRAEWDSALFSVGTAQSTTALLKACNPGEFLVFFAEDFCVTNQRICVRENGVVERVNLGDIAKYELGENLRISWEGSLGTQSIVLQPNGPPATVIGELKSKLLVVSQHAPAKGDASRLVVAKPVASPTLESSQPNPPTAERGLLASVLGTIGIFLFAWYFFGGGLQKHASVEMDRIEDQVAQDAVNQYRMAERNGNPIDVCVHAGFVAAAYSQANDESNYRKWKRIEESDCREAGVPR